MTEQERPSADRGEQPGPVEPPDGASSDRTSSDRALLRLETRLARAEAQILGLQESMADVHDYFRLAKQRSLYLRIGLLLAALAAFLYLRYVTSRS